MNTLSIIIVTVSATLVFGTLVYSIRDLIIEFKERDSGYDYIKKVYKNNGVNCDAASEQENFTGVRYSIKQKEIDLPIDWIGCDYEGAQRLDKIDANIKTYCYSGVLDTMQAHLTEAVESEDYETAAKIRDEINNLNNHETKN